jgi:hypothetical protein
LCAQSPEALNPLLRLRARLQTRFLRPPLAICGALDRETVVQIQNHSLSLLLYYWDNRLKAGPISATRPFALEQALSGPHVVWDTHGRAI